jgi:hypothetical protein
VYWSPVLNLLHGLATALLATLAQAQVQPPPDADHAWNCFQRWAMTGTNAVYDSSRRRLVCIPKEFADRIWEWDGLRWHQVRIHAGPIPVSRDAAAIDYFPPSRLVLKFGGVVKSGGMTSEFLGWNGTSWIPITFPGIGPSPRSAPAMAYDSRHRRLLLAGGFDTRGALRDSWEWDGLRWYPLSPPNLPSSWSGRIVYDSRRDRMVLVTETAETWEWDGLSWVRRSLSVEPPARLGFSLVYDQARAVSVLFGGHSLTTGLKRDLWEYDGVTWRLVTPMLFQDSRQAPMCAYDTSIAKVVIGSGSDPLRPIKLAYNDLWAWDGSSLGLLYQGDLEHAVAEGLLVHDAARVALLLYGGMDLWGNRIKETFMRSSGRWSRYTTPTAPGWGSGLAFDTRRQRILLLAGPGPRAPASLWEWSQTDWKQVPRSDLPYVSTWGRMTFDDRRGVCVYLDSVLTVPALWEFDGINWSSRQPAVQPPFRTGHSQAYDSRRGWTLVFGGLGSAAPRNDLWAWDGVAWRQLATTGKSPPPRVHGAMCHDALRDRTVLLGGYDASYRWLEDHWEWDGRGWQQINDDIPLLQYAAVAFEPGRNLLHAIGGGIPTGGSAYSPSTEYWQFRLNWGTTGPGDPVAGFLRLLPDGPAELGGRLGVSFPSDVGISALALSVARPIQPPLQVQPPGFCLPALIYPDLVATHWFSIAGNPGRYSIAVPPNSALQDLPVTLQAFVLNRANCMLATNGLVFVLRPR